MDANDMKLLGKRMPTEDLISRAEAIDALDGELTITGRTNAEAVRGYVKLVKDRLERLPSAQPEQLGTNLAEVGTEDLISRQAALDCFHDWIDKNGDVHTPDEMPEYRAIEALPSAQPEPCEDAVGRDAVVRFLDDWISALDANCHHQSMADLKIVKNDFKNLPSAQPMRKRGKWILDRSGAYCCSECMEPCAGYVMMRPRDKFCKMCGADMRGDADE